MHWYTDVLSKYTAFDGRAGRQEFWMFTLISVIIYFAVAIIGSAIHMPFLIGIYALAVLLPTLAVEIRRLHDIDKSGWWILIGLVPAIGGIWLLVLLCMQGTQGANRFGASSVPAIAIA